MKQKIYIDTSVIGGCFDEEFEEASNLLIDAIIRGELIGVISEVVFLELEEAPPRVRDMLDDLPKENFEYVELTEEASNLAKFYITEKVIELKHLNDAEHIAVATVSKVDVLVSWNFKHIVNLAKIRGFNAVNLKMGYNLIDIRSPWEVIKYEKRKKI